jgi:fumarate hydratase class I
LCSQARIIAAGAKKGGKSVRLVPAGAPKCYILRPFPDRATMPHAKSAASSPIRQADVIASVTDALQYISYYHSPDFVQAMAAAYEQEQGPAAKDAIKQILVNSRMCAEGHRPICQDTGIVTVFCKVGMNVRWADATQTLDAMINEGVRQAYNWPDNKLRASIVDPPAFERKNTRDNTPAVIHTEIVAGDTLEISVAAKGGGSENKSKLGMLNPSDSIVDFVCEMIPEMGAGWCPPGVLGIGIGGTAEKAMIMAKESLLEHVDIAAVRARGPRNNVEKLRLEILDRVNALGVGAQGLGGLTTLLDVKIMQYPTHAASLPVAIIPNCAATRHTHFVLDGSGPASFAPPDLSVWPKLTYEATAESRRVNLNALTRADVASFKPGERLLLNGRMLTGRDAAHKRICELLEAGKPLPAGLDFTNRVIYYVGPVDPVGTEVVGPAGPTTATRMDKFTETMLGKAGLIAMIGKSERGEEAIEVIRRHKAAYLMAVGGSAYLVSKAIKASRVVAFPELGMEAVYEFEVQDMPVTVAVDSNGESVHTTGPAFWKAKIAGIPVRAE